VANTRLDCSAIANVVRVLNDPHASTGTARLLRCVIGGAIVNHKNLVMAKQSSLFIQPLAQCTYNACDHPILIVSR
jgi:hypothetical protein